MVVNCALRRVNCSRWSHELLPSVVWKASPCGGSCRQSRLMRVYFI